MPRMPNILGDFSVKERELASHIITQAEYQAFFEKTRTHGFKGDIFPFAVGGSDAAVILGESPWKTPLRLYMEKTGLLPIIPPDEKKRLMFLRGHLQEAVDRDMFTAKTGLKTQPCTLQVQHPDFPHLVANIDGIVWENGKPGIYEGKTTHYWTSTQKLFSDGQVPTLYLYQVLFYMEVWDLDFAYINCSWGHDPFKDMKHVRVQRDPVLGKEICRRCEEFVLNAKKGIRPTNADVLDLSLLAKDNLVIYGKADPSLPTVSLKRSEYEDICRTIDALNKEEAELKKKIQPTDNKIAQIRDTIKPEIRRLDKIKKERQQYLYLFTDALKQHTRAELEVDDCKWTIEYDPSGKPIFDADVKAEFRSKYPDIYQEIMTLKPNYNRNFKFTKTAV